MAERKMSEIHFVERKLFRIKRQPKRTNTHTKQRVNKLKKSLENILINILLFCCSLPCFLLQIYMFHCESNDEKERKKKKTRRNLHRFEPLLFHVPFSYSFHKIRSSVFGIENLFAFFFFFCSFPSDCERITLVCFFFFWSETTGCFCLCF